MKPFTLDNHFTFGYSDGIFNLDNASIHNDFWCRYSKAKYIPTSFRDECVKVAEMLTVSAKALDRTPVILLSGGMDSHVVVKSFLEHGKNFHTMTTRFSKDLNNHELFYANQLQKEHNFSHDYLDLDIENWLVSDEAMYMADQSLCAYAQMLPTMKLIQHVWDQGGMPVLGNGDFYAVRSISANWRLHDFNAPKYVWEYVEYEYILAWFRYAIKNGIVGGLGFFQHTPEIALAMGLDPQIKKIWTDKKPFKMSTRSTKYEVYKKYWPEFVDRQKYNGGEKILGLCDKVRKTMLVPKYGDFEREWKSPCQQFIKSMLPL
jgi:hypothetical protein